MKQSATRRLVKSPPELWAEVSSEDSLGRHLAEFGEIKITRVKPETTVAWEGDRASGTVELAPTGWGTKVILTATPAKAPPPAAEVPPEPIAAMPAAPAAQRSAARQFSKVTQTAEPAATPARIEPRPQPAPPQESRGFFSRLFRKRAQQGVAAERVAPADPPRPTPAASIPAPPAPAPDPAPPTPTPQPGPMPPAPDPVPPTPAPQPPPPPQIRSLDSARTEEILGEVLDNLGSAHHRPFSRD